MGEFLVRRLLCPATIGLVATMLLGGCNATGAYSVINCEPQLAKVRSGNPTADSVLSMTEEKIGYFYDDGRGTPTWHWVDYDSKSGRCVVTGQVPFTRIAHD